MPTITRSILAIEADRKEAEADAAERLEYRQIRYEACKGTGWTEARFDAEASAIIDRRKANGLGATAADWGIAAAFVLAEWEPIARAWGPINAAMEAAYA